MESRRKKKIVILGSTGSIGKSAVEIISHSQGDFEITGLAAGSSFGELGLQLREFPETRFALGDEAAHSKLIAEDADLSNRSTGVGIEGLLGLLTDPAPDLVINALVGISGLVPTVKSLEMGYDVALANKESLVTGGEIIDRILEQCGAKVIPVDSEHFSLSRCLKGHEDETVEIILTASGGPFLGRNYADLEDVSVSQVLDHPTWNMGRKVTVDSAHLLNKGLEVIEAHWLFGFGYDSIGVVIHPQSIVHAFTRLRDGSMMAHLGPADMKLSLISAMHHPGMVAFPWEQLSVEEISRLDFLTFDPERYPAYALAMEAARTGGTSPAVLNAADEAAVEAFLAGKIGFLDIVDWIEEALSAHRNGPALTVEDVLEADRWTRKYLKEKHGGTTA
jgi:1-deoxy-D-xylulose-5-phosphate reductoisomerase